MGLYIEALHESHRMSGPSSYLKTLPSPRIICTLRRMSTH